MREIDLILTARRLNQESLHNKQQVHGQEFDSPTTLELGPDRFGHPSVSVGLMQQRSLGKPMPMANNTANSFSIR